MSGMVSPAIITAVTAHLDTAFPSIQRREWDNDVNRRPPNPPVQFYAVSFPDSEKEKQDLEDRNTALFQEEGVFMIHIFAPSSVGLDAARTLGEQIYQSLSWNDISGVKVMDKYPGQGGPRYGGLYEGVSFAMEYVYESYGV